MCSASAPQRSRPRRRGRRVAGPACGTRSPSSTPARLPASSPDRRSRRRCRPAAGPATAGRSRCRCRSDGGCSRATAARVISGRLTNRSTAAIGLRTVEVRIRGRPPRQAPRDCLPRPAYRHCRARRTAVGVEGEPEERSPVVNVDPDDGLRRVRREPGAIPQREAERDAAEPFQQEADQHRVERSAKRQPRPAPLPRRAPIVFHHTPARAQDPRRLASAAPQALAAWFLTVRWLQNPLGRALMSRGSWGSTPTGP